MKNIHLTFALTLLLCSCAHLVEPGHVDWPDLVQCGPGVDDIVGTVSRVLLADGADASLVSQRGRDELEQLALEHGASTVACLVDLLVREWTSPGATMEPTRIAGAARGRAFLQDVGTEVQPTQETGP